MYQPEDRDCVGPNARASTVADWHSELDDADYSLHLRIVHGMCGNTSPSDREFGDGYKLLFCRKPDMHTGECTHSWSGGVR